MDNYKTIRSKSGAISFQINKKVIGILVLLSCFMLIMIIVGLSMGSTMIHPVTVLKHILGIESSGNNFIINILRLPRVMLAILVGASLAVSGLILQGIVRNPLASPDIIGITGGASAAAVFYISFFSGILSMRWLPVAAIIGAGIVSIIIYLLAWNKGVTPIRLVLIGIGISATMGALTTLMIVLSPINTTAKAYVWLTGSVYGANWMQVYAMLPWVLIFVPLAILLSRIVNVKELGDDIAYSLGVRVQLYRSILLFVSVALAGSAVAYGGGIGFVGLIAPHIARRLVGRSFAALVPTSLIIGGLIVLIADLIARTAFLPIDLPAGVLVSGVGAPFFIYLLYRHRNRV